MSTKIKLRRDTKANWESVDPILAEGEIGYCKDTKEIRIGDGIKRWSELEPSSMSGVSKYSEDEEIFTGRFWIDGKTYL